MQGNSSWIMHRGRTWGPAALREGRDSGTSKLLPAMLDDIVVSLCFLALVALLVLGGLVMFFSSVSKVTPPSAYTTCATVGSCSAADPTEDSRPANDPQLVDPVEAR